MSVRKREKLLANEVMPAKARRKPKGPEPERLKISGYRNWEDAIAPILGKRRPPGGWAK
jgi:hypothetical protein